MLFGRSIDDLHDQGYETLVFAWPGTYLKVGPASDDKSRQNLKPFWISRMSLMGSANTHRHGRRRLLSNYHSRRIYVPENQIAKASSVVRIESGIHQETEDSCHLTAA
jgi:hypothetical protein